MLKKPRILVVGSFMMDLIASAERAPNAGETVIGKKFTTAPGGKGVNQAVQCARLGAHVTMAGRVGDDAFGRIMTDAARAAGVDVSHVSVDPAESSGVGHILLEVTEHGAQNRITVCPGANYTMKVEDIAWLREEIGCYDMLMMQFELPMEVIETAAEWARDAGVPVMVNPAPAAPISPKLLSCATYLSPNEHEAALIAARKNKKSVQRQDFMDAVDRIVGGLEKRSKITTQEEKRSIAIHEAGHASISWLLRYANPLIKVTIVPRGRALGAAWYLPEERQITTREQMLDEMCATLGGRAAEEVFLGRISTGASNDLERVTKQAYAMVVYFGMSEKLPNLSYYDSTGQEYGFTKPYSEDTAKLIDEEVSKIVSEQYERAKKILKENADKHAQLAEVLISREVIFSEDVEHIFGKRPWVSRSEEILQDEESAKQEGEKAEKETQEKDPSTGNDNTYERENKTEEKPEKDSENT